MPSSQLFRNDATDNTIIKPGTYQDRQHTVYINQHNIGGLNDRKNIIIPDYALTREW